MSVKSILLIGLACLLAACTDPMPTQDQRSVGQKAEVSRNSGDSVRVPEECMAMELRNGELVSDNQSVAEKYASVGRLLADMGSGYQICTGILLRHDVVMTALHCISQDPNTQRNYFSADKMTFDLQNGSGQLPVRAVYPRPFTASSSGGTAGYVDVALLALDGAYPASTDLFPVYDGTSLPMTAGAGVTLVGAGYYTSDADASVFDLGKKRFGSMSFSRDRSVALGASLGTGTFSLYTPGATNQMACQGDSGGPVFYTHAGVEYIVGIAANTNFAAASPQELCRTIPHANFTRSIDVADWVETTLATIPVVPPVDPDTTAPVPGSTEDPVLTGTSVALTWAVADDDRTAAARLRYRIYYSTANNIRTVADAESNGTAVGPYRENIAGYTINGLTNGNDYYFTVIVSDEAGNKAAYPPFFVSLALVGDDDDDAVGDDDDDAVGDDDDDDAVGDDDDDDAVGDDDDDDDASGDDDDDDASDDDDDDDDASGDDDDDDDASGDDDDDDTVGDGRKTDPCWKYRLR